ncbi:MAG TPA: hypothetical protein DCG79_01250 [Clostridiales bacterium]|nr:hypothetical protein [Clostridiales bacterium]
MDFFEELALEAAESAQKGVKIGEEKLSPSVRRLSFIAPSAFGEGGARGKGTYHTLLLEGDPLTDDRLLKEAADGVARSVALLCGGKRKRVLAVGLGNPSAVVDALGTECVKRLSVGERGRAYLATFVPSVFGVTGLETARVVKGVASQYRPDLILTVDTLSTRRIERLFHAVQVTDGGVVPGGGVANRREPISGEVFHVPVLSLGVPLLARLAPTELAVAPKEIDLLVPRFALALAAGVERGLFQ